MDVPSSPFLSWRIYLLDLIVIICMHSWLTSPLGGSEPSFCRMFFFDKFWTSENYLFWDRGNLILVLPSVMSSLTNFLPCIHYLKSKDFQFIYLFIFVPTSRTSIEGFRIELQNHFISSTWTEVKLLFMLLIYNLWLCTNYVGLRKWFDLRKNTFEERYPSWAPMTQ